MSQSTLTQSSLFTNCQLSVDEVSIKCQVNVDVGQLLIELLIATQQSLFGTCNNVVWSNPKLR